MSVELIQELVAKLLKDQPRNETVIALGKAVQFLGRPESRKRFDRKAYMREYMRQRRAKTKAAEPDDNPFGED